MAAASVASLTMDQNNMPAWGSYLYQNFLLPALSPNIASQWLTSPFGNTNDQQQQPSLSQQQNGGASGNPPSLGVPGDYFGSEWQIKTEPGIPATSSQQLQQQQPSSSSPMLNAQSYQAQPPSYSASQLPQQQQPWSFFGPSIPTSLLTAHQSQPAYGDHKAAAGFQSQTSFDIFAGQAQASGSRSCSGSAKISPSSVEVIDDIVASPSPLFSSRNSPHHSPKKGKRRALSIDSNEDHYGDEQDHEVPEGVERDGMIWGMKVEDYRALSARERKRVRNRISARTFRAKRKGQSLFTLSELALLVLTLADDGRTSQLARKHPQLQRHSDQTRPRRR